MPAKGSQRRIGYSENLTLYLTGTRPRQSRTRPSHPKPFINPLVLLANRIFEDTLRRPESVPVRFTFPSLRGVIPDLHTRLLSRISRGK
jgi:hypothetical protein